MRLAAIFASLLVGCLPSQAELLLHPLLTSNGILQRDKSVPISGKATPGEKITVSFRGQIVGARADQEGRWLAELSPMPAASDPASLIVEGTSSGRVELSNLLVGDVWLCAGQSNMDWYVANSLNGSQEMAAADFPSIRLFRVGYASADTPQNGIKRDDFLGHWKICSQSGLRRFSAVAYFFARELHQRSGVPIGVIMASRGGTQIESWMSADAIAASPYRLSIEALWQERLDKYPARFAHYEKQLADYERRKAAGEKVSPRAPRPPEGQGSRWTPAGLFNAMVHPLIPFSLRGILWYQGEANVARFEQYGDLIQAMIRQWRKDFGQDDLAFYFVQLAGHQPRLETTRRLWAFQREAQMKALELPNTGAAIAIDLGEERDVHPKNKQDVGLRLALAAWRGTYGADAVASGPVFREAKPEGNQMRLFFEPEANLVLKEVSPNGFEVAGTDRVFHEAKARIEQDTLVVSSPKVSAPVAVRYAWFNYPPVSLYNTSGLPASPFRSDDWPPPSSAPENEESEE